MIRAAFLLLLGTLVSCHRPPRGEEVTRDFTDRGGKYTLSYLDSEARGRVYFTVYLPPQWSPDDSVSYPLIIFLHGQTGDEFRFSNKVAVSELNEWINGEAVRPFVLIAPRGADRQGTVQWYHNDNVTLLTSDEPGELRAFCRKEFRAGMDSSVISVHGQSRGATGALHLALSYPDRFASAVANAFVSDYYLSALKRAASQNRASIDRSGIQLRMTIGTRDYFVLRRNRRGSPLLSEYLEDLGIRHEYEVLPGVTHDFSSLWHHERGDGLVTGLYELQFHERAWNEKGRQVPS